MAVKKAPAKKKSMALGGGGRFAALEKKVEAKGKSPEAAKAIAAKVGMEKYGKPKMEAMAKKGKARAAAAAEPKKTKRPRNTGRS